MASHSKHVFHLRESTPVYETGLGSVQQATATEFPILKNLSIERLVLPPGSIREPHWLANANELAYCIRGTLMVSILATGNKFSDFGINSGEMFHVESGALHHIENVGHEEAEVVVAYRHEKPEDFSLAASFGAFTDAVIGNTYDMKAEVFASFKRNTTPKYIVKREGRAEVPVTAHLPNTHKFNVEGMVAPIQSAHGSAKTARLQYWPDLDNMAMYSLRIPEVGMREPHWHPTTAEMGYVHKGQGRMSVMDPDGSVDTYYLKPGDVYFVPVAYPHQIEVIGSEPIHWALFFDQNTPGDVGFRTSASALSREVLASTLDFPKDQLPPFPYTVSDPLLVGRINPVDPPHAGWAGSRTHEGVSSRRDDSNSSNNAMN